MPQVPLHASPGRMFLAAIVGTIILGGLLLSLPAAQAEPLAFFDVLFTATSATCVTGMLTIPLHAFTFFGKIVILSLIQMGGLGLITLTVFFISIFFNVGIKTHLMAGQLMELESWKNSKRLIKFIISLTVAVELVGAIALYYVLPTTSQNTPAWFSALFHSISSFCSAGISILDMPLTALQYNIGFLTVTATLMLVGQLGFITWHELAAYGKSILQKKRYKLSLHSKLVLSVSTGLIIISGIFFLLCEWHQMSGGVGIKLFNALYNAIGLRSCGFNTLPVYSLQPATLLLIMIICFIGSSAGSTGGGIKNTSVAVLFAVCRSVTSGKNHIEIRGRTIPTDQVMKVVSVFTLALIWIIFTTFILLITEPFYNELAFLDLLFEAVSAFANLGLSRGITPLLSPLGKSIILISMILGRIGALTLILSLKKHKDKQEFYYPAERIMLS